MKVDFANSHTKKMPIKRIFAITFPDLLGEWVYSKNKSITDPYQEGVSSSVHVWWKCSKCGYLWNASIRSRTGTNRTGCPCCSNRVVWVGHNDLATTDPLRAAQWNYDKNTKMPTEVTSGSKDYVWWICPECGETWQARVCSSHGRILCRSCLKKLQVKTYRKTILRDGNNTLMSKYPVIAQEWSYEKNGITKPSDVVPTTQDQFWWDCPICKQPYLASVVSRTVRGKGCPICKKMFHTSFPEQAVYYYISKLFDNVINAYHPDWLKGSQEIDIFIPSIKLGIEYDGAKWHKTKISADTQKGLAIYAHGINLIRIREFGLDLLDDKSYIINTLKPDGSDKYIDVFINQLVEYIESNYQITNSISININRDRYKIYSLFVNEKKENSILDLYPNIASEWNYEKNYPLKPENVFPGSDIKVSWICKKCGFKWEANIYDRCKGNHGCRRCAGFVVWPGHNDLATMRPCLIAEWDPIKNTSSCSEVSYRSDKKAFWICSVCGSSYSARIADRSDGSSCPYCSHTKPIKGKNDLKTLYPEVARRWDYDKNENKKPEDYLPQSNVSVYWKCNKCGQSVLAPIYSKIKKPGCPYCDGHKVLPGFNDLETVFPQIAKEWDWNTNKIMPSQVHCGSKTSYAWICSTCGHKWKAQVSDRTGKGSGCRECSIKKRSKAVVQMDNNGNVINEYKSIVDASKSTGIDRTQIGRVALGNSKHAGGFVWKYKDD